MITWKNMDTLASYQNLQAAKRVDLPAAMSGEAEDPFDTIFKIFNNK